MIMRTRYYLSSSIAFPILIFLFWTFSYITSFHFFQTFNVTLSAIISILLFFSYLIVSFIKNHNIKSIIFFLAYLTTSSVISAYIFGVLPHAGQEFCKVILVFAGGILLSRYYSCENLLKILKPLPYAIISIIIMKLVLFGTTFEMTKYQRLWLSHDLGGPNTIGFLLALSIILLIYQKSTTIITINIRYLFIGAGSVLLIYTFSRSAILGVIFGLLLPLFYSRKSLINYFKRIMFFFSILICLSFLCLHFSNIFFNHSGILDIEKHTKSILSKKKPPSKEIRRHTLNYNASRFNPFENNTTILMSGRLQIWEGVIKQSIASPLSLMFGFGPGLLTNPSITSIDQTTGSIFFTAYYSYGLIGALLSIIFSVQLLKNIIKYARSDLPLIAGLGILFLFGLWTNNSTSAEQLLLPGMLLVALLFNKRETYGIWNRKKL